MADGLAAAVIGGVITAGVAVVVAVLTQVWTTRRDRAEQLYQRRRAALVDVQDAALDLRTALAGYGARTRIAVLTERPDEPGVVRVPVADSDDRAQLRAEGRLEVCASRVDDPRVVEALRRWHSDANAAFLSTEDVTAAQEQQSWTAWTRLVGEALRSSAGLS